MFWLQLNIIKLTKLILLVILLGLQFLILLVNGYGATELDNRSNKNQSIKTNNSAPSETLFTKKDIKSIQSLSCYYENQKFKHNCKIRLFNPELLLAILNSQSNDFQIQEAEVNNTIPRSPPQHLI